MTPPLLSALHLLLVGVWVGMYLFTTWVVSPAFAELFPDEATRSAHRRTLGRQYARVNGPLTLLLLATLLALGFTRGFGGALLAELAVLLLIGGLIATHIRRAGRVIWIPDEQLWSNCESRPEGEGKTVTDRSGGAGTKWRNRNGLSGIRIRPPAWIAHATLAASALLCGLTLAAHG